MSTQMSVFLSQDSAAPHWGEKALLSFAETGATIHLGEGHDLGAIQRAARQLDGQGIHSILLAGDNWDLESIWAFHQGYRNPKKHGSLEWVALSEDDQAELQGRITATDFTRDIINKTAEEVAPRQLATMAAEFIKSVAPEGTVTARIVKDKDLLAEGWEGIYAVGSGSERTSAMLQLDYNPTGDENAPVFACLVGKGITFDSGGYSLKPSNFMSAMKADMGGSGTITGGLGLAILRGLNKRVKLILCCAENMVSGRALKLGDIITYKNGKTVEIMNTDAEGRLVLADGLIYASEQNPELIIDCATLTGAAKNALGNDYHALMSFDDELSHQALTAANQEKEGLYHCLWLISTVACCHQTLRISQTSVLVITHQAQAPLRHSYLILLKIIRKAGCTLTVRVRIANQRLKNGLQVQLVWVFALLLAFLTSKLTSN